MDIQKINKAAGEVLAGMSKDLTSDEKIAVLDTARGVIQAIQLTVESIEMREKLRQQTLDNFIKKPTPFATQKH